MLADTLQAWEAGNLTLVNENERRGLARALLEMNEIQLDNVRNFYGVYGAPD